MKIRIFSALSILAVLSAFNPAQAGGLNVQTGCVNYTNGEVNWSSYNIGFAKDLASLADSRRFTDYYWIANGAVLRSGLSELQDFQLKTKNILPEGVTRVELISDGQKLKASVTTPDSKSVVYESATNTLNINIDGAILECSTKETIRK